MRARRASAVLVTVLILIALPAQGDQGDFATFTDPEFQQVFDSADLPGVAAPAQAPSITGDTHLDTRIRRSAEKRGYRLRPTAHTELVTLEGVRLHPDAAEAWNAMQAAARAAGHSLRIISGYRSVDAQRALFLRRLEGFGDSSIDATLARVAPPGYSKHHTGHAIDITQQGFRAGRFHRSPGWEWLTDDNAHNAKRFGFIPSYPPEARDQGPDPEPWEWTYVGVEVLYRDHPRPKRQLIISGYTSNLLIEDLLRLSRATRWEGGGWSPEAGLGSAREG